MAIEPVTDFRVLLQKAIAIGEAERGGDEG